MVTHLPPQEDLTQAAESLDDAERNRMFRGLVVCVNVILAIFTPTYGYLGATISAGVLGFGLLILSPFTLYLIRKAKPDAARLLFILSCNIYIFIASLGTAHRVNAEYFCLPAMMLGLLLFNHRRLTIIIFSGGLALANWSLMKWGNFLLLSPRFVPDNLPHEALIGLNFVGAFGITVSFFALFVRSTNNDRRTSLLIANRAREEIEAVLAEERQVQAAMKVQEKEKEILRLELEEAQRVANVGSWKMDIKTSEISWSKQMFSIFGFPPSAGVPSYELLMAMTHEEDRHLWLNWVSSLTPRSSNYKLRYRITVEKQTVWIETVAEAIGNEKGEVVSLSGTCQDVTERVLNDEKHQFILESLKIGVWNYSPTTHDLIWDSRMYSIFGVEEGRRGSAYSHWLAALEESTQLDIMNQLELAIRGEKDFDDTFTITTASGEKKYIGARGIVSRNRNGEAVRILGINWDRTHEVELEKSLVIERANMVNSAKMASLGEMSAGIAHEINNPLAIIIGKAEKLQRIASTPGAEIANMLNDFADIKRTSHRIAAVIKGLRTFSRNSENDPFYTTSLTQLIADTLSLCRERFKSRDVELVVGTIPAIEFDARATQISQILLNLLNNSFDAIVDTKEPWIRLEVLVMQDTLQFVVTDSGQGIPPAIAAKIMQPFFTTKDIGQGTGLGLSISQGMAQDHGGTLTYDPDSAHTRFVLQVLLRHNQAD